MEHEDVQQEPGIAGIVLRSRRPKALAVIHQNCRVNGKDHQVVVFGQHEHQRPSRLFESYGDRLSSEPHPKFSCPDFNRLRCVVDGACFDF